MIDFSHIERNYDLAKTSYSLPIPEEFNFAYDVIDRRAAEADKTALIAIGADGKKIQNNYLLRPFLSVRSIRQRAKKSRPF